MFLRHVAVVITFLSLGVIPCLAQASRDEKELEAYILTMDNVTHTMQATTAANEAGKKDPALGSSLKGQDSDSQQSLDQMTAKLGSSPTLVAILARYSLTPRTYALTLMSMITTGFAVAAIDAGAKQDDIVRQAHINPANIAFVRAHKAEIDELGKKYPMSSN